jgi:peptide/nickel transport system permease protein
LQPPGAHHILGTDEAGADVWTRIVTSTRLELLIATGSTLVALLLGVPLGLLAGYGGKVADVVLSAFSSATLAFPLVLFAILVVASFGASPLTLVGILGFLFFPRVFLLMRAQTRSLREREFVAALTVTGISPARKLFRHILPNTFGALFTLVPQLMAEAILVEAGLSYLGLGIQAPATTWGTILRAAKDFYVTSPTYAATPGITITLAAGLLMYAGHLLAESADPRRRRSRR